MTRGGLVGLQDNRQFLYIEPCERFKGQKPIEVITSLSLNILSAYTYAIHY